MAGELGIPVVVISDVDSSDRVGAAIDAGACWHVAKTDVVRELPLALGALFRKGRAGLFGLGNP